jgi:hypothetical protein
MKQILTDRIDSLDSFLVLMQDELCRLRRMVDCMDIPELPWDKPAARKKGNGKARK